MIALLCSVQAEAEQLLAATAVTGSLSRGSKSLIEGTLAGRRIMLCVGGMGKVNAAHTATLLAGFNPAAMIIFGIGGAYPSSGAKIGDVALAKEEIAGDEGVFTADGFKDTEYMGIPLLKTATSVIYTTYPAQDSLVKQCSQSLTLHQKSGRASVHIGTFVTLSTCTGTTVRARELEERYHGLCENMEGAAASQVAGLHNIPWIEVRGISNMVEDRNLKNWNIPGAAQAAQQAVLRILEGWKQ